MPGRHPFLSEDGLLFLGDLSDGGEELMGVAAPREMGGLTPLRPSVGGLSAAREAG